MLKRFKNFALIPLFSLLLLSCSEDSDQKPIGQDDNMAMGNPSNAGQDFNNYLIQKAQYALSYNNYRGTPNWVSWHLNKAWLGEAPRQDDFKADVSLPAAFYKVTPSDYTNSGFDRGHNCPSADRTLTISDNSSTFLMTNMIPQAPINNQQTWANLENYCRKLVVQGNELYIIMGNYGKGGTGNDGFKETLAGGKVTVPNRIWKVILVLPEGSNDISRVSGSTRVIAIDTPNSNNINTSWGIYRTTVDAIEAKTGYNILSNVPEAIQQVIEARVDSGPTS